MTECMNTLGSSEFALQLPSCCSARSRMLHSAMLPPRVAIDANRVLQLLLLRLLLTFASVAGQNKLGQILATTILQEKIREMKK